MSTRKIRRRFFIDRHRRKKTKKYQQDTQQKMQMQFKFDMQLKQMDVQSTTQKEGEIENRKDKRSKMEATQQSELISQRQNDSLPKNFEDQGMVPQEAPLA